VTLVEAARLYVKNSNLIWIRGKLQNVKAELVQSKGQDSRSARYLKDLAQKLSAFVDDFAGGCRFWLIWVASCIHSGKTVYF
jgi:hypothetical protein